MFGLWIARDMCRNEEEIQRIIHAQLIPFGGFTDDTPPFSSWHSREDFLRQAAAAVMQGMPIPLSGAAEHLCTSDAAAGNVLRKYVCLRISLMPYLRRDAHITRMQDCFLLGRDLLVIPLGMDGCVDALLPCGVWTELATGETFSGRVRFIRGLNAMPILARENSVIPIGVNDRTTDGDDADRLTLHWFQPQQQACCQLADGTVYHLTRTPDGFTCQSAASKPWHLIVHRNGEEIIV